jgi:predicted Zn-dependent protease
MSTKAILYFSRAIDLDPDNVMFKLTRARELMRLKKYHEADADLKTAADAKIPIAIALHAINSEALQKNITATQVNQKIKMATAEVLSR